MYSIRTTSERREAQRPSTWTENVVLGGFWDLKTKNAFVKNVVLGRFCNHTEMSFWGDLEVKINTYRW